jgi:hypothetical protein
MLSTASLLARRTGLVRGVATAVAPKLDWAHLQSLVHSDEAKREVGKLKKLFEDTREALAVQSKVRKEQGPGERGRTLWEKALQRPSHRLQDTCWLALAAQRVAHIRTHVPMAAWQSEHVAALRHGGCRASPGVRLRLTAPGA